MSHLLKLKQNEVMAGLAPPAGKPLAGQKFVFQAAEWNGHTKYPMSASHPPDYCVS